MAEARTPLLGLAGAAIGSFFGAAGQGLQYGLMLGSVLDVVAPPPGPRISGQRIDELRVMGMAQGSPIPTVWGRYRLPALVMHAPVIRTTSEWTRVGGKGGGSREEVTYLADLALCVCTGPIHSVRRIWANREVIYDNRSGTPTYAEWLSADDVVIYLGTESQAADSVLASGVPSGELPAYRGLAYIVLENFNLSRFGRAVPQIEVEVQTTSTGTVALSTVSADLAALMGCPAGSYDFSALSGIQVRGCGLTSRQEASGLWQALMTAYQFDLYESGGVLQARLRGGAPAARLSEEHIGLDGEPDYAQLRSAQEAELPRLVEVAYISEDLDFQRFTQRATTSPEGTEQPEAVELAVVMGRHEAARVAMIELLRRRLSGLSLTVRGLPRLLEWEPTDVLAVPTIAAGEITAKVSSVAIEADGHAVLQLVEDDPSIYLQPDVYGAPESGQPQGVAAAANPIWEMRDSLPALSDADASDPRLYVWGASAKSSWFGGAVRWAGGGAHAYLADEVIVQSSAVLGQTVSSLAAGPTGRWDRTSTVDVELISGTLVSVSETDALNWANLCMIGDELLIYRTATLVAPSTWRLSNLIRGVRGTGHLIQSPRASGARFVLAASARSGRVWSDWEQTSAHEYLGDVRIWTSGTDPTISVALSDGTLRPYQVCRLQAETLAGGDVRLSWTRRARRFAHRSAGLAPPLDYDVERYAVHVCSPSSSITGGRFRWSTLGPVVRGFDASGTVQLSTAATAPELVVPAATWVGIGPVKRVGVCQIGVIAAIGYEGHGTPLVMDF